MLKKSVIIILALAIGIGGFALPARAQRVDQLPTAKETGSLSEGIAAVVGEDVVTTGDVRDRLSLALLSAGMPDTPEIRARLLPQVLKTLIEEQLQLQEGKKLGLSVSPKEMKAALEKLAQDNKIPGGDMEAFISSHGVPPSALRAQIRAALIWNKVVAREVRPEVNISDEEVEASVRALRDNAGKQEFLISEILIPFENDADQEKAKAFAGKLMEQLKAGAIFGAVARQFSQGTGAGSGGDMGWIQLGELSPEIDELLLGMQVGEIAGPVLSNKGYHIIGLRDRRVVSFGDSSNMKIHLAQAFRESSADVGEDALIESGKNVQEVFHGCSDGAAQLASFPEWHWQDLGEVKLNEAPSWLVHQIETLQEGQASAPMLTAQGALVLFLCERSLPENIDREAIRNVLGQQKLERMARRLLRDLQRDAFLDIRLKAAS